MHGSCGSTNWNQVCHLQWINNCINMYLYLLCLVMHLQKCHGIWFWGGINTIPCKSQTAVHSSLFRGLSLAYWIFVQMIFPHPDLWMLEAFLVWILICVSCEDSWGSSPAIISVSAFTIRCVSQTLIEALGESLCENASLWLLVLAESRVWLFAYPCSLYWGF